MRAKRSTARETLPGASADRAIRAVMLVLTTLLCLAISVPVFAQSRYSTSEGRELFEEGLEIERDANGDPDVLESALSRYEDAVARDPELMPAWARIGYILYALGRHEEAVELLSDAAEESSDNAEVKQFLGVNLYRLGREDEAAEVLTEVLNERNDLPEALFILGKYHLERRQDDEARPLFERYQELSPDDLQGYRALATLHLRAGELDAAEADLQTVLDQAPDDVSAHINLGHVYYARADLEQAQARYQDALELDPGRLRVRYDLASVLFEQEDFEQALEQFEQVLADQPRHFSAMYFRAECLFRLRELNQARTAFEQLVEREPRYGYAYLKLAWIALLQGQDEQALELIQESGVQTSDEPVELELSGKLYRTLGRLEDAVGQHRRLVNLAPRYAPGWIELGLDHLAVFEYSQAVEAFQQAGELEPDNGRAWEGLSVARMNLASSLAGDGEVEKARQELQQVVSLDVHRASAHANLALLALGEGDVRTARRELDVAKSLSSDDPGVARVDGRVLVHEGKYETAVSRFEVVTAADPNLMTGAAWHDLAVAYQANGQRDAAWTAMTNAEDLGLAEPGNVARLALSLGLSAADGREWDKAEELLEKAKRYEGELSNTDRIRLDYGYGIVALRNGRFRRAEKALEDARDAFDDLSSRDQRQVADRGRLSVDLELAWAYYENGKLSDALSALGSGKRSDDEAALERAIRERLAIAAFEKGDVKDALDHLERAAKLDSTPVTELNLAAVRYVQGQRDKAGDVFASMADRGMPEAIYNHAIYLEAVNKPLEAIKRWRQYLDTGGRKSDEVRKLLEVKERVWGKGGGNAM